MVARDHTYLDARAVAFGDSGFGFGSGRIDNTDHRQQRQVLHEAEQISPGVESLGVEVAACDHHYTLTVGGHAIVLLEGKVAVVIGNKKDLPVWLPVRACAV